MTESVFVSGERPLPPSSAGLCVLQPPPVFPPGAPPAAEPLLTPTPLPAGSRDKSVAIWYVPPAGSRTTGSFTAATVRTEHNFKIRDIRFSTTTSVRPSSSLSSLPTHSASQARTSRLASLSRSASARASPA